MRLACLALSFACAACGASQVVQPPQPAAPDEGDTLRSRFEQAYFEVACMANAGRDPEMTITPLKRPLDYLEGLEADRNPKLSKALAILLKYGFGSVTDFKMVEMRLRGEPDWWNSRIDARFVDALKSCR